ncbi:TetR family transcriptional regulator [Sphingomonas montanisoli]|uniref:TetR family transcriptional regulator n=2 Tax=Sphingomonas montanisoli TaxID=2606412 RepID=A0A5D9BY15_9SPHN|nr:TetR family transcriptional regulator [Sphingomonas montanisoli]
MRDMGKQQSERPARRERGSISAEEIIAGALALAEAEGLDALSMPRLGRALGIGVTSIYWYFDNKDALIDAITIEAARRLHDLITPPEAGAWQDRVEQLYCRMRDALRDNDLLCDLLYMRGSRLGENALVHLWPEVELNLTKMTAAGFTAEAALRGLVALSLYTRGAVVLERQMRRSGIDPATPTPVPADFPLLSAAAEQQNMRGVTDDAFRAQLRLLIDGLAALSEK